MSVLGSEFPDDELLDALADGELGEPERRQLLTRLDQVPGGWRRCALALLEAQCWRREFHSLAADAAVGPVDGHRRGAVVDEPRQTAAQSPATVRPKRFPWGTALAMAASFLVALGLGVMTHRLPSEWWPFGGPTGGQLTGPMVVTGTLPETREAPTLVATDGGGVSPVGRGPGEMPAPAGSSPWKTVRVAAAGTPGGYPELPGWHSVGSIRLPAVEKERLDENWLRNLPDAMPSEILEQLKQVGYDIRKSRQLLPVDMPDGRRLVVPVDQVDAEYVGNPTQ
jgi:hypothetical protein